ncbi:MAG: hypothetical protein GWM90_29490 [Gemmatimonadetes bacterium]|nr:hypothetical protein [Gemmatimonadota bacterium]NIQ52991.1 hypothetical protein [Gemmatimonadota bacterium]NIU73135.1 hypothetical protein [Gammaproteobacteria bacterium]NIX48053.1 hypothetical protein [Gemmatimonadota bacterium]NIY12428.1 hypothetical protein [Gemmatimonadota bacterium]
MAAVWLLCSLGGGAVLALLARRMHPALSFRRLWLFYSTVLALGTAAVLAIGWY